MIYPSADGKGFFVPAGHTYKESTSTTRGPRFSSTPHSVYPNPHLTRPSDGGPVVASESEDDFNPFFSSELSQLPATDWTAYVDNQSSPSLGQAIVFHDGNFRANHSFVFPQQSSTACSTHNNRSQIREPTTLGFGNDLNGRNTLSVSPIGHRRPRSKASSNASGNTLENTLKDDEDWPELVSRFQGALAGIDF